MRVAVGYADGSAQGEPLPEFAGYFERGALRLAVVVDGGGPQGGGADAARLVARTLADAQVAAEEELGSWLVASVRLANRLIYESGRSRPSASGQAASLAAVAVLGHRVAIAHVGAARVYLRRGSTVELQTRDHTLLSMLVEHQGMTPEQAAAQVEPGLLSRALGLDHDVRVDLVGPMELEPGDSFVLCSSTVGSLLTDSDLEPRPTVSAHQEALDLVERLLGRLDTGGGSVVVVRTGPSAGKGLQPTPVPEVERVADMLTPSTADLQLLGGFQEQSPGVPSATSTALGKSQRARVPLPGPAKLERSQDWLMISVVLGMVVICGLLIAVVFLV